jgi:hypothetical protein
MRSAENASAKLLPICPLAPRFIGAPLRSAYKADHKAVQHAHLQTTVEGLPL